MAACTSTDQPPTPPKPTRSTASPDQPLTFGAFGTEDEIAAYTAVTESFNSSGDHQDVQLEASADYDSLLDRIHTDGDVPDIFMVSRDDLAGLLEAGVTQPVDALLDERGVDFGDGYSRDGLQAFSAVDRLQCMPYSISPRVIYYNTDLVDFDAMAARGLPVPDEASDPRPRIQSWSFDEFTAAAEFAAKPRRKTRGIHVEPTLESLAPFLSAAGGKLFDDDETPTSLAFSDGDSQAALSTVLPVLRNPLVTLSEKELAKRTPLEWFERGKLAMIEGYRRLVPELRQVQGLEFDVLPVPYIETSGTVGEVIGLCLSADSANTATAADFLVQMLSTPAVSRVVRAGSMVPANLEVALSDDFLQPGRLPAHAGVFNSTVRSIVFAPLLDNWSELERAVRPSLERLLNEPLIDDLAALTEEIDAESRTVLDPEGITPSGSPTESTSVQR